MMRSIEGVATQVLSVPEARRLRAWESALDESLAAALDEPALQRALDFNARLATRVRELCEARKVQPPWGCPRERPLAG